MARLLILRLFLAHPKRPLQLVVPAVKLMLMAHITAAAESVGRSVPGASSNSSSIIPFSARPVPMLRTAFTIGGTEDRAPKPHVMMTAVFTETAWPSCA